MTPAALAAPAARDSARKLPLRELRLVPPALVMWAVCLVVLLDLPFVAVTTIAVAIVAGWAFRQRGQGILAAIAGLTGLILTSTRASRADDFDYPLHLTGTLAAAPKEVSAGSVLLRVRVDGLPEAIPVFLKPPERTGADGTADHAASGQIDPLDWAAGARVTVQAFYSEATQPGVIPVTANGTLLDAAPPTGFDAWTAHVATTFSDLVAATVGSASQGLIPGMVLGDTSLQDDAEQQLYIETGLSHLSAVSGANVSLVCAAAIMVCRALSLGPKTQCAAAAAALGVFVGLVGTEPSVLRAAVTGIVGLLAIVGSRAMEPMHALAIAIIVCLTASSGLAANYGFALSCAATAGIVAVSPLLYRYIAPIGLPDIVGRTVAVAIAADLVTMPIIALMAGEVSVVSVLANVLVVPATAPVTILGLIAAGLALLPWDGPATLVLHVIEPFTWWINTVALGTRRMPVAIIPAHPMVVIVAYGWIVAGLVWGKPRMTACLVAASLALAATPHRGGEVDVDTLQQHVVELEEHIDPIPAGTQVIVVLEHGPKRDRPTRTADGIPVLYPNRDGQVRLYRDGQQHAADGRF